MKGTIAWSCVACSNSETYTLRIKLVHYDPGSCFTALWAFLLPAKRRINVHTLYQRCLADQNCDYASAQLNIILKKRAQHHSESRVSWLRQQWHYWITSLEYQGVMESVIKNKEIHLHIFRSTSLAWATAVISRDQHAQNMFPIRTVLS